MVDIHHRSSCNAPLDVAFAYLDDYRTATKWMFGLSRFEPVGEQTSGLGAVFDGAFAVKPVQLSSRLEITRWEQDKVIALDSIKGFKNSSTWEFHAEGPERTAVTVLFRYELPGGLAGKALGKALGPIVTLSVRRSDENLRHQIEQHWAATRSG